MSEKPEPNFQNLIRDAVNAQVQANYDAVETMCWKMLEQTKPRYGVLVEPQEDGTVKVTLSPEVPFMTIHWQLP